VHSFTMAPGRVGGLHPRWGGNNRCRGGQQSCQ